MLLLLVLSYFLLPPTAPLHPIRALEKLNISANAIASKEAGKALAEVLKTNTVLKELDVSDNMRKNRYGDVVGGCNSGDGPGFAKELAAGVSANGALATITFGDEFGDIFGDRIDGTATLSTSMTQADFSSKNLGPSGAVHIVVAFLPKCQ